MSGVLFVSGTDTDAGKTFATAAILRKFSREASSVAVIKPVQTGCSETNGELIAPDETVYEYFNFDLKKNVSIFCFEKFRAACAPNLAARLEKRTIDTKSLLKKIQKVIEDHEVTIIEGAGGLMVPLSDDGFMVVDLVEQLKVPLLLVAPNRVGAINHIILNINELGRRQISVCGIILNQLHPLGGDERIFFEDNFEQIRKLCPGVTCFSVPFFLKNESNFFKNVDDTFRAMKFF